MGNKASSPDLQANQAAIPAFITQDKENFNGNQRPLRDTLRRKKRSKSALSRATTVKRDMVLDFESQSLFYIDKAKNNRAKILFEGFDNLKRVQATSNDSSAPGK
jgi:hypothetical protein